MCHKLICGKCSRALRRACPQISRSVTSGRASQVNSTCAKFRSCRISRTEAHHGMGPYVQN